MAEVIITFDTETKLVKATLDGEEVQNITSVSIYQRYCDYDASPDDPKKFTLSINTAGKAVDGLRRSEYLTASDKGLEKASEREEKLGKAVASFLKRE